MEAKQVILAALVAIACTTPATVVGCPLSPPCCPIPCPVTEPFAAGQLRTLRQEANNQTTVLRSIERTAGTLTSAVGHEGTAATLQVPAKQIAKLWNVSQIGSMIDATQEGKRAAGEELRHVTGPAAFAFPMVASSSPSVGGSRVSNLRQIGAAINLAGLARNDSASAIRYIDSLWSYSVATNVTPGRTIPEITWSAVVPAVTGPTTYGPPIDCRLELGKLLDVVNTALIARDRAQSQRIYEETSRSSADNALATLTLAVQQLRAAAGRPGSIERVIQTANGLTFTADWMDPSARDREISAAVARLMGPQVGASLDHALRNYLEQLAYVQWEASMLQQAQAYNQTDVNYVAWVASTYGLPASQGDVAAVLRLFPSGNCELPAAVSDVLRGAISGNVNYVPRSLLSVLP
jgi:hypothetical protein